MNRLREIIGETNNSIFCMRGNIDAGIAEAEFKNLLKFVWLHLPKWNLLEQSAR